MYDRGKDVNQKTSLDSHKVRKRKERNTNSKQEQYENNEKAADTFYSQNSE